MTKMDFVKPLSEMSFKTALAEGPVLVGVEADSNAFQMYTNGILDTEKCGTSINHIHGRWLR